MCNHKSCHQRLKCRGKVAGGHLPYWNKLILGNILPHQDELLLNGNHSTWKIHLFSRQCWLCITAPIMMVWNLIHLCDLLVFVGWFVWWPTVWLWILLMETFTETWLYCFFLLILVQLFSFFFYLELQVWFMPVIQCLHLICGSCNAVSNWHYQEIKIVY